MPARPTWKGTLKLSLIAIPIKVFPATDAGSDVSFKQLHRKCHTPIRMKKWCPHCDEEVGPADIVKGHATAKGRYVIVDDEEIASVRPESTRTVDISRVLDAATIDPIYIERAYFLTPDNKAAGAAFAVLREALDGKAAVGRLALHGREYLTAVLPRDKTLILYTLRTSGEVRDASAIDGTEFVAVRPKPEEVKLARQVLQSFDTAPDLSAFTDHYEEALRAVLAKKHAVEVADAAREDGKATTPVNLMDALRRSLASVSGERKRPARAAARKSARVLTYAPARKRRRAS